MHRLYFLFFLLLFTSSMTARSSTPLELASSASKRAALKPSIKAKGPLVILDAGHGGSDEGAKVKQLQEKKITLLTTLYTKKKLEELGYSVLLTRKKDHFLSLPKRVTIANQTKGILFISIHCNAAPNSMAQGLEIYYYKGGDPMRSTLSLTFANLAVEKISHKTGCASRGVKPGRFYVIKETTMPSVLIEIGFLTNHEEWHNMRKKTYLEKVAEGIVQGVHAYIRLEKNVLGAS